MNPHSILRPIAEALISVFYAMTNKSSDSQTSATWTVSHWENRHVPLGYEAELKLKLKYTGNGATPKRREGDK